MRELRSCIHTQRENVGTQLCGTPSPDWWYACLALSDTSGPLKKLLAGPPPARPGQFFESPGLAVRKVPCCRVSSLPILLKGEAGGPRETFATAQTVWRRARRRCVTTLILGKTQVGSSLRDGKRHNTVFFRTHELELASIAKVDEFERLAHYLLHSQSRRSSHCHFGPACIITPHWVYVVASR